VDGSFLNRYHPHSKIVNDMQQKPSREDAPSINRYYMIAISKCVHVQFSLEEWMHEKYNKYSLIYELSIHHG